MAHWDLCDVCVNISRWRLRAYGVFITRSRPGFYEKEAPHGFHGASVDVS